MSKDERGTDSSDIHRNYRRVTLTQNLLLESLSTRSEHHRTCCDRNLSCVCGQLLLLDATRGESSSTESTFF